MVTISNSTIAKAAFDVFRILIGVGQRRHVFQHFIDVISNFKLQPTKGIYLQNSGSAKLALNVPPFKRFCVRRTGIQMNETIN
jgi:hypothetical protein